MVNVSIHWYCATQIKEGARARTPTEYTCFTQTPVRAFTDDMRNILKLPPRKITWVVQLQCERYTMCAAAADDDDGDDDDQT